MKILCGLLFVLIVAAGKEKDLDWKKGTLAAVESTRELAGASATNYPGAPGGYAPTRSAGRVQYQIRRTYTIQGEAGYTFRVECAPRVRLSLRPRVPNVTVNGPIRYAIAKGKYYMLDEDGKNFEMTVLEKALPKPE